MTLTPDERQLVRVGYVAGLGVRRLPRSEQELAELELYRTSYSAELLQLQLNGLKVFEPIGTDEDRMRHNLGIEILEHMGLLDAWRNRQTQLQLIRDWMRIKTDLHFRYEREEAVGGSRGEEVDQESH